MNRIKKILKEQGRTQTWLAKKIGKSYVVVTNYCNNIPVPGDCEQVISCRYDADITGTNLGSIDDETIRKEIVNIIEGGKEAFNNRKRIYELWTH